MPSPSPPPLASALEAGVVVLDGGLSTELEAAGHDVTSALWSARLLRDDPAAVVAAHGRFFAAGARVATTASYQASVGGFLAAGVDRTDAEALLARSVELARTARALAGLDGSAWVAASVGPYGAVLPDGSQYTGGYADRARPGAVGVRALRRFHRPRLDRLAAAGADVLACETLPAAAEVEALLSELSRATCSRPSRWPRPPAASRSSPTPTAGSGGTRPAARGPGAGGRRGSTSPTGSAPARGSSAAAAGSVQDDWRSCPDH